MPGGSVDIAGATYQVALSEELARSGAASDEGAVVPAVGSGGRVQRAFWRLSGAMGQSRSYEQVSPPDYAVRLDHRFDGVLTTPAARNSFSITSEQPQSEQPIYGDGVEYGEGTIYAGTHTGSGEHVGMHDDDEYLYIIYEGLSCKVEPLTMSIEEYVALPNPATDMLLGQDGRGYVCLGHSGAIRRRDTTSTPHSYAPVTINSEDIEASKGVTAGFRTFIADPDSRHIRFTVDGFTTISGLFPVGPTNEDPNGLGAWSGFTFAGYDTQVSSFTENGNPTPLLSTPLVGLRDDINGSQWVEQWGFNYTITRRGVYSVSARDYALVGLNALPDFEGPGGVPTAIDAVGESLFVAYLDEHGDTHICRGLFDRRLTPGTGAPAWYSFDTIENTRIVALGATGLRPQPTLIAVSEEGTVYWWELGSRSREISDPGYTRGDLAGEWYGATFMGEPNRIAVVRKVRFQSEGGAWTFGYLVDDGDEWADLPAHRGPGFAVIDLRQQDARFHTLKPRLQLAAGEGQLRGLLEVEYLERPEVVEVRSWVIVLGGRGEPAENEWVRLNELLDPDMSEQPVSIDDGVGWITGLTQRETADSRTGQGGIRLAEVTAFLW